MSPESRDREQLPKLAELSEKMSRPPSSVRRGLLITAFLPGMGEVYLGNRAKGTRFFHITVVLCLLSVLTSRIFIQDETMLIQILHSALMLAVIWMWVRGMIRTIQYYEAQDALWRFKKGAREEREKFDLKEYLRNIREKGGKHNVEVNLDEMINNPRRAIIMMSLIVSLTFIATKVNGFLDKVWIANLGNDAVAALRPYRRSIRSCPRWVSVSVPAPASTYHTCWEGRSTRGPRIWLPRHCSSDSDHFRMIRNEI